jgi:hypothetical protein
MAGRLAAQLQRDGREILGCRAHHIAPDRRGPGKEQVVEGQRHEFASEVGPAVHDRKQRRIEMTRDESREEFARSRRGFRHLHEDAVARGERRGRSVPPRGRSGNSMAPRCPPRPAGWNITRERPGRNHTLVARCCGRIQRRRWTARVACAFQRGKDFQQPRLFGRASLEIRIHGVAKLAGRRTQHRFEGGQCGDAFAVCRGAAASRAWRWRSNASRSGRAADAESLRFNVESNDRLNFPA